MNLLLAVVRSVPCRGRPGRGSLLPVLPALPWLVAAWPPSRHPAAAPPLWQAAQRPAPPPANGRPTRGPNTLRGELTVNADKESGWGIRRGAIFGRQNRPGGRGEAAPSRGAGFQLELPCRYADPIPHWHNTAGFIQQGYSPPRAAAATWAGWDAAALSRHQHVEAKLGPIKSCSIQWNSYRSDDKAMAPMKSLRIKWISYGHNNERDGYNTENMHPNLNQWFIKDLTEILMPSTRDPTNVVTVNCSLQGTLA